LVWKLKIKSKEHCLNQKKSFLIKELLKIYGNTKLMAFAEKLCDQFGFYNPQGQKQRSGCLKALRELEQADLITLPQPLPQPRCVPSEVGEIGELRLMVS